MWVFAGLLKLCFIWTYSWPFCALLLLQIRSSHLSVPSCLTRKKWKIDQNSDTNLIFFALIKLNFFPHSGRVPCAEVLRFWQPLLKEAVSGLNLARAGLLYLCVDVVFQTTFEPSLCSLDWACLECLFHFNFVPRNPICTLSLSTGVEQSVIGEGRQEVCFKSTILV